MAAAAAVAAAATTARTAESAAPNARRLFLPSHGNSNYPTYSNQYTNNDAAANPNSYQSLLIEVDKSTIHEMALVHQAQNLLPLVSSLTDKAEYLSGRIGASRTTTH